MSNSGDVDYSSGLFDSYEQDFIELSDNIRDNIIGIPRCYGEERMSLMRKLTKQMEMIDRCIRNMDVVVNSNEITDRKKLKAIKERMQEYNLEHAGLKKDFVEVKKNIDSYDKKALLGDDDYEDYDRSYTEYGDSRGQKIAEETKRLLDSGSESLDRTLRNISDIENQGTEILSELGQQREQIMGTKKRLSDVNEDLRTSKSILSRMEWRNMYSKIIVVIIILILLGSIGLFLYFQFRS
ncbi:vesicle transport through interaction with t-SNAREs protein [Acrasis kona]|uniref:Vesicle transport through interaction with t-SNAREs protein n=1 Tax=Acrasis kona TaxID=1008807 RepID=A0AAW2YNC6_9EUKA